MSLETEVKFSHDIAEQEVQGKLYKPGQYFSLVVKAEKKFSKEKPEIEGVRYKMFQLALVPLTDPSDISSTSSVYGFNVFNCLPFWDEDWDSLDYNITTKHGDMSVQAYLKRNMGLFMQATRDLLAALKPEVVPARPQKQENGNFIYSGEEIEPEDYKACNIASKKAAGELAAKLWNEGPSSLEDTGCYHLVKYNNSSDFPQLYAYSSTQLIDRETGENMDLVTL